MKRPASINDTFALLALSAALSACGAAPDDQAPSEKDLSDHGEAAGVATAASGLTAQHCVARIGESATDPDCFDDFSESVAFATHGRVVLPEGTTPETMNDAQSAAIGAAPRTGDKAAGSIVVAIHYDKSSFGGKSLVITNTCGCDVGCYGYVPSMPKGWDNVITSTQLYAGCGAFHYEDPDTRGRQWICYSDQVSCAYLAGFDNVTSSVYYVTVKSR